MSINSFISNIASSFFNSFTDILLNSPTILLHLALILFVFFFGLRDGEKFVGYIKDLSPLSKESEEKISVSFKTYAKYIWESQYKYLIFLVFIIYGATEAI